MLLILVAITPLGKARVFWETNTLDPVIPERIIYALGCSCAKEDMTWLRLYQALLYRLRHVFFGVFVHNVCGLLPLESPVGVHLPGT